MKEKLVFKDKKIGVTIAELKVLLPDVDLKSACELFQIVPLLRIRPVLKFARYPENDMMDGEYWIPIDAALKIANHFGY